MLAHELYRYCVVCGCPSIHHKQVRNYTEPLGRFNVYECKCKKNHLGHKIYQFNMFEEYDELPDDIKFSILMKEAIK